MIVLCDATLHGQGYYAHKSWFAARRVDCRCHICLDFHRVLDSIEEALVRDEALEAIPADDVKSIWEEEVEGLTQILGPVWADDGAFFASHEDPELLVEKANVLAVSVFTKLFNHGLTPNFSKGKSEMLITLRGQRSRKAQTGLFGDGQAAMELDLGGWGCHKLRLVTEYVHLGCALERGATMHQESLRRLAIAASAFDEHRSRIYQNTTIPVGVRGSLFTALIETRLFNLEVWRTTECKAWNKLRTGHMKLIRRMLAKDIAAEKLVKMTLAEVATLTRHPTLDILLRAKRLRYMVTLVRGAPAALWAMLHHEKQRKQSYGSRSMHAMIYRRQNRRTGRSGGT